MSDNLTLYNKVRTVPPKALKEIQAGRLKGKSDINPMWRLKTLTEHFGPCGVGWKYVITKQWLENGGKDEIAAFVNIDLYFKADGVWSDPIPGTGGNMFVASESRGLYTSDECYKMALTDALGVACKALGFGADVYWEKGSSKYDRPQPEEKQQTARAIPAMPKPAPKAETPVASPKPVNFPAFWAKCKEIGYTEADIHTYTKCDSLKEWTREQLASLMAELKGIKAKEMEGK